MQRRMVRLGLFLGFVGSFLVGCQLMDNMRPKKDDDSTDDTKVDKVQSSPPKGFFQNSRLSGAMSDEGREIERSLGIQ